jgi:hypothetical protein
MTPRLSDGLSDRVGWPAALVQAGGGKPGEKANESPAPLLVSSPAPGRMTLARVAAVAEALDERDLAILASVARVRMLTGGQLQRLHFASVLSPDRQARRVLARLTHLAVLARLERQVGGRRAGSSGFVYTLGLAGQRLAGDRGPAGGRRRERPWTPSTMHLAHHLLVSELYVEVCEAEMTGGLDVLEFEAEPACWRPFMGPAGAGVTLRPDAFVRLGVGETERLAFIEMDLATESPTTLERKLDRYRLYVASGIEQERWGTVPMVTWVVPDEDRANVVAGVCQGQPRELWPLFVVVPFGRAVEVMAGGRP